VKLPIYYCPVKVKKQPIANVSGDDRASSPSPDPAFKIMIHTRLLIYEGGAWRNVRASTLEKAKTKGKKIAKRLAENALKPSGSLRGSAVFMWLPNIFSSPTIFRLMRLRV